MSQNEPRRKNALMKQRKFTLRENQGFEKIKSTLSAVNGWSSFKVEDRTDQLRHVDIIALQPDRKVLFIQQTGRATILKQWIGLGLIVMFPYTIGERELIGYYNHDDFLRQLESTEQGRSILSKPCWANQGAYSWPKIYDYFRGFIQSMPCA